MVGSFSPKAFPVGMPLKFGLREPEAGIFLYYRRMNAKANSRGYSAHYPHAAQTRLRYEVARGRWRESMSLRSRNEAGPHEKTEVW